MIVWKHDNLRPGSRIHTLMSGAVPVGTVAWNPGRSRGEGPENSYAWSLQLPGKRRYGFAESADEAKALCLDAFADWCAKARLLPIRDQQEVG